MQIFTRHRQAEITDAHWLAEIETRAAGAVDKVHGTSWQTRRNGTRAYAGPFERLKRLPGYLTRACGLSAFGVAALATLVVVWVAPDWLG